MIRAGHHPARRPERRGSQSDAPSRAGFSFGLSRKPGRRSSRTLELSLPHGLLIDVTVDSHGQMTDYQILSGADESGASASS